MMMKFFVYVSLKAGGRENSNLALQGVFKKKFSGCPCISVYQGQAIVIRCLLLVVLVKQEDVFFGACRSPVARPFCSASCVGFQSVL